jgi:hypothetical protein
MKPCGYCGRENDDTAMRCMECGTPFTAEAPGKFSINKLLKVGAWICLLFGIYIAGVVVMIFVTGHAKTNSTGDTLVLFGLIIYPFFALVPFYTFVYPGFKPPRKSVSLGVALLEILVVGLFLWPILFPHL